MPSNPKHDATHIHRTGKAGVDFTLTKKLRNSTSWFPVPFFMENHVSCLVFYIEMIKKASIYSKNIKIDA